jgi:hypothetical protein
MKAYFAMGLFALYVALVFLARARSEQEFARLAVMKKMWGRTRGIAVLFLANVALPLVLGIVFLGRGVADFGTPESRMFAPLHHRAALAHMHVRPAAPPVFIDPAESIGNGEIALLLAAAPTSSGRQPVPTENLAWGAWDFVSDDLISR